MRREMPLWVVIVIVCVVGLAAGGGGVAGALYLEKRGPAGPAGPRGPAGTGAEEALARAGEVEDRLSNLEDQLSATGLDVGHGGFASVDLIDLQAQVEDLEFRVDDLELAVQDLSSSIDSICASDPRIVCF